MVLLDQISPVAHERDHLSHIGHACSSSITKTVPCVSPSPQGKKMEDLPQSVADIWYC